MYRRWIFVCLSLFALSAFAESDVEKIKAALAKSLPSVPIGDVRPSPIAGIYEAVVDNELVYVSADGRYLLTGDLIEIANRTNLSTAPRNKLVLSRIEAVGEDKMMVMGPIKAKRTITVFTDVDCPYCARLHQDVPELNRHGVRVRYLFFPRTGIGSDSYNRAVAVWCAKDRAAAMSAVIGGGKIPMSTCPNPVAEHYRLGESMGVRGTPTIVFDDGTLLPGYVPAPKLLALLGIAPPREKTGG